MTKPAPHPLVRDAPGGTCWKRSDKRRTATGPSSHAELVVLHAFKGRADYVLDGNLVELHAGSLLWALAGQAHFLLSDSADFDMWVFLISERAFKGGQTDLTEMPPFSIQALENGLAPRVLTRAATQELSTIAGGLANTSSADIRLTGLRWWLARAWAHWQSAADTASRRLHPAVDRAAVLLQNDPLMPVRQLARQSGLSPSRLAHVFKTEVGLTLQDYRTELKLDHVDHLVAQGKVRDLLAAALEAGFGSYSQFFRVFTAVRGMSPRDYYKGIESRDGSGATGERFRPPTARS